MEKGKKEKCKKVLKKAKTVSGKVARGAFKSFLLVCILLED